MAPAILVLSAGYFVGGAIGDFLFKRTIRGRIITAMVGVLTGAILLNITFSIPIGNQNLFLIWLMATALFIPFASPNIISTVYDITPPEVRSTVLAVQYFIENGGAALAPLMGGILAKYTSLHQAILVICVTAWILGAIFLALTAKYVPEDIASLRHQMRERAELERQAQASSQI
jgi:MFS family permease